MQTGYVHIHTDDTWRQTLSGKIKLLTEKLHSNSLPNYFYKENIHPYYKKNLFYYIYYKTFIVYL